MKVILLHGDNLPAIAKRVTKFVDVAISRGWKIEKIDANTNLLEALSARSLFGKESFFILEEPKRVRSSQLAWLKQNTASLEGNLVVVNFGLLPKTFISQLPKPYKIEVFDVPKKLWAFIDSLSPGNGKICLLLFHEALETVPPELICALVARRLKDLYLVKLGSSLKSVPWQARKLENQASKFTKEQIAKFTTHLARADYKAKTGVNDFTCTLDLIIATQLE